MTVQNNNFIHQCLSLGLNITQNVSIAPYTTFKIGGNADMLVQVNNTNELKTILNLCENYNIRVKILGGASNVLVNDEGFRGLIIINRAKDIEILNNEIIVNKTSSNTTQIRYESESKPIESDSTDNLVLVNVASGVKLPFLMNYLWKNNISGLEVFAGIPATVGGAVYMNMHGANKFFGNFLQSAEIWSKGKIRTVDASYFEFDYDYSILHKTKEIILSCNLILAKGNVEKSKEITKDWINKKRIQPQRSAGCIFQNLNSEEQKKHDLPTPSAGYLIDKVLELKGFSVGDAQISETHAAFIVNKGNATAKNVLELINTVKEKALEELSIKLETEIEYITE